MASRLNFEIDAGASWIEPIEWQGQNISNRALRIHLKRKIDGAIELELSEVNGRIVVTDGALGKFEIRLNAVETAGLSGEYIYDVILVDDSVATSVDKLLRGFIFVRGGVTS